MRYMLFLLVIMSVGMHAKNPLVQLRRHVYVKAFLDVIAYVEGTDALHGYKTLFTGKKSDAYTNHPNQNICITRYGAPYCSTAAGRYQLNYSTWSRLSKKMKAYNFGPVNQDYAMIQILYEVGALGHIKKGDVEQAVKKLGKAKLSFKHIMEETSSFRLEDLQLRFYRSLVAYRKTDSGIRHLDPLRRELKDPHIRAFLDMIAYAEGTNEKRGYHVCFTGKYIKNLKMHPGNIICAMSCGSRLCSTATGRYQFLKRTWDDIADKITAQSFSAIEQDRGAVQILSEKRALLDIKNNRFEQAVHKISQFWASLPGSRARQPQKKMDELKRIYYHAIFSYSKKGGK